MYEPRPPQLTPPAAGRSVLETAVVAVGTTVRFVAATVIALAAATLAGDDPAVAAAVAATALIGALVVGVLGVRRVARFLERGLERRRAAPRTSAPAPARVRVRVRAR